MRFEQREKELAAIGASVVEQSRCVAERIDGARYVELAGTDSLFFAYHCSSLIARPLTWKLWRGNLGIAKSRPLSSARSTCSATETRLEWMG